ncbi:MotA/TolQ/ExbB proton channel family protein [Deltaproteobacteria bacterium TL4]
MSPLNISFQGNEMLALVIDGSVIGQMVLFVLVVMSSLSWAIIILKAMQFRKVVSQNKEFSRLFRKESRLDQLHDLVDEFEFAPDAQVFKIAYREVSQLRKILLEDSDSISQDKNMLAHLKDRIQRVMELGFNQQYSLIEARLSILATISSAAPFIGLFGTVLGIINSFQNIGTSGVTSLAAVAPGISEALIATAAGLLAAIPALIAYNYFRNQARQISNQMREFSLELSNRMEWIVHERFSLAGK